MTPDDYCGLCAHWHPLKEGNGECAGIPKHRLQTRERAVIVPSPSDSRVTFITEADFGCRHFQKRNQ